jgi:hypothetical protein
MPQEIADRGERHSSRNEPGSKGMAEIVEVKVRQSCPITGAFKAMPHIIPPMTGSMMKHPRHIRNWLKRAHRISLNGSARAFPFFARTSIVDLCT